MKVLIVFLSLCCQVTELYHDASLGNAVDLVIVRIILLEEDQVTALCEFK